MKRIALDDDGFPKEVVRRRRLPGHGEGNLVGGGRLIGRGQLSRLDQACLHPGHHPCHPHHRGRAVVSDCARGRLSGLAWSSKVLWFSTVAYAGRRKVVKYFVGRFSLQAYL